MGMIFTALGGLCFLAAFGAAIMILISAFQESPVKGLLCLCVPCYVLYYAIVEFQHEKKGLILAFYFGGGILGNILFGIGSSMSGG